MFHTAYCAINSPRLNNAALQPIASFAWFGSQPTKSPRQTAIQCGRRGGVARLARSFSSVPYIYCVFCEEETSVSCECSDAAMQSIMQLLSPGFQETKTPQRTAIQRGADQLLPEECITCMKGENAGHLNRVDSMRISITFYTVQHTVSSVKKPDSCDLCSDAADRFIHSPGFQANEVTSRTPRSITWGGDMLLLAGCVVTCPRRRRSSR